MSLLVRVIVTKTFIHQENIDMSKIMNEETVEQIQQKLCKLVDKVESIISSNDLCDGVCEKYKDKIRTPEEQSLFRKCGCLDSRELEELEKNPEEKPEEKNNL